MKYIVTLNGTDYEVEVNELNEAVVTGAGASAVPPAAPVTASSSSLAAEAPAGAGRRIAAPMSGTILNVGVCAGQTVREGDILFVLETMKMENEIPAPAGGTVLQVLVTKGSAVAADDTLAYLD